MIKRYHEAPIAIFDEVQKLTDGDYALVHLFDRNEQYLRKFEQAIAKGRDVILDNSIFELGHAFDGDKFAEWIEKLQPSWYIVPDSWKNGAETIEMFHQFVKTHPHLPGKRIGVAQGSSFEEVALSYRNLEPQCDMIAFNLDFAEYSDLPSSGTPYCLRMSVGRWRMISDLFNHRVINTAKPHHLLGCGVPQETLWYPREWKWIRSIDTCNPVIHGMHHCKYDASLPGMIYKHPTKMCDHIDDEVSVDALQTVKDNIRLMTEFCK